MKNNTGNFRSEETNSLKVRSIHRVTRCLVPGILLAFSSTTFAGTLQGQVFGLNKAPRPYLRIDFSGPTQITAVTDVNGRYQVSSQGGSYRARISEQSRRWEEYITIPASGVSTKNVYLSW